MVNKKVLRIIAMATIVTGMSPSLISSASANVAINLEEVGNHTLDNEFMTSITKIQEKVTTTSAVTVNNPVLLGLDEGEEVWENEVRYTNGKASDYTNFNFHKLEIKTEYNIAYTYGMIACSDNRHIILKAQTNEGKVKCFNYDIKTETLTEIPVVEINTRHRYGDYVYVSLVGGGYGVLSLINGDITPGSQVKDAYSITLEYANSKGVSSYYNPSHYARYRNNNLSGKVYFHLGTKTPYNGIEDSKLGLFYSSGDGVTEYRLWLDNISINGETVSKEVNKRFSVGGEDYIIVPNYYSNSGKNGYSCAGVDTSSGALIECPFTVYKIDSSENWSVESDFYAVYEVDRTGGFAFNVAVYSERTQIADDIDSDGFLTAQNGVALSHRLSYIDDAGKYVEKNEFSYYRYNKDIGEWETTSLPLNSHIASPTVLADVCISAESTDDSLLRFVIAGRDDVKTSVSDFSIKNTYFWTLQSPNINKLMFTCSNSTLQTTSLYINYGFHYNIRFEDEDGTTLSEQIIYEGESATAPEVPAKDGYEFSRWDTDFDNVESDLTVKAIYSEIVEPPVDAEPEEPPVEVEPPVDIKPEEPSIDTEPSVPPTDAKPIVPPVDTSPNKKPNKASSKTESGLKLIDVYKDTYIKNSVNKLSNNKYSWENNIDNMEGTLEYTQDCYTVEMDSQFDKDTNIIIYDNFAGKKAKLYSYIEDTNMYALINEDITNIDGTLSFKTTNKGKYIITSNALPKEKVISYWHEISKNKWVFYEKYSDERITGWHKAESGEWYHNGKDSEGDYFHISSDTIMDTGWFRDKDGKWYYLDALDGSNRVYGGALRGWWYLNNTWFHFDNNGCHMSTGWFKDTDNKWYFLNSDGSMAHDMYVNGYWLGSDGAYIK